MPRFLINLVQPSGSESYVVNTGEPIKPYTEMPILCVVVSRKKGCIPTVDIILDKDYKEESKEYRKESNE